MIVYKAPLSIGSTVWLSKASVEISRCPDPAFLTAYWPSYQVLDYVNTEQPDSQPGLELSERRQSHWRKHHTSHRLVIFHICSPRVLSRLSRLCQSVTFWKYWTFLFSFVVFVWHHVTWGRKVLQGWIITFLAERTWSYLESNIRFSKFRSCCILEETWNTVALSLLLVWLSWILKNVKKTRC